jgi:uncharacterized protein (DUF58 family)
MASIAARQLSAKEATIGRPQALAAEGLAGAMPRLVADARRAAASYTAGIHGRRRAGVGESFWQFRPFASGEPAQRVDWRRSARDDKLYVREREWEAAQAVFLWPDRSPSMAFQSSLAPVSKLERAIVLSLAVADMLVRGGERVGLIGGQPPIASRRIIERLADALVLDASPAGELPVLPLPGRSEAVVVSDCIAPLDDLERRLRALSARGARGCLVRISDPAEETLPFAGQTEFIDPEDGFRLRVGEAEAFRVSYHQRLAAHTEGLDRIAKSVGWRFLRHVTDRPASEIAMQVALAMEGGSR